MLDYTHAQMEVTRDDFHLIHEAIHHLNWKLYECLKHKHMLTDEMSEYYEKQYQQTVDLETRLNVKFVTHLPDLFS